MPRARTDAEIRDFRQALCDVAAERFATQGYDGVTMRGLASALRVSPMTPYRYFPSKGAIYRAIRTHAFARFSERMEAAVRGRADPLARLRALLSAYLRFAKREPGAYRIMFELTPPQDAAPDDAEREAARATWNPLLQTLRDAVRAGLVRGDPLTLAHLCWVQVHGLVSLHLSERLVFERTLNSLRAPLFETLLHGMLPPEGQRDGV